MKNLHKIKPQLNDRLLAIVWWFQNNPITQYSLKIERNDVWYRYPNNRIWISSNALDNYDRWANEAHIPWAKEGKPLPDLSKLISIE